LIAILSPHLDDAVLSCWSVLTSNEEEVRVVNVFAGLPDREAPLGVWDSLTGASSSRARMAERIAEDRDVLARLGHESVDLQLLDSQYMTRVRDSQEVLNEILPATAEARLVYSPAGIGGHPDHLDVRVAAGALRRRGKSVALYADLPYCNKDGWPAWLTNGSGTTSPDVAADWQRFMDLWGEPSVEALHATVRTLSAEQQLKKRDALLGYRSQATAYAACVADAQAGGDSLKFEAFWPLGRRRGTARFRQLSWRLGARRGSRAASAWRHLITP
jgi:LmbE family N-acetylglucosaminyl deacetylase